MPENSLILVKPMVISVASLLIDIGCRTNRIYVVPPLHEFLTVALYRASALIR